MNMEELKREILRAGQELVRGKPTDDVRLALLRPLLKAPRAQVDAALLELHTERRIILSRDDNTFRLKQADHDAALHVGGGCPRHLFYILKNGRNSRMHPLFKSRRARANGLTPMTYGEVPPIESFRAHLRSFTVEGEKQSVKDSDGAPVFYGELNYTDANVARHAAKAIPDITFHEARRHVGFNINTVAALHEFIVSLAHHWGDGNEQAGDLASSIMASLGYEWI